MSIPDDISSGTVSSKTSPRARTSHAPHAIAWRISNDPVDYETALATMDARVAAIAEGRARELVWLLQHPPLFTAGTSAKADELIDARFPVHVAGRGGQFTYHGPGQRVAYVMLDLRRRGPDVRRFVSDLEEWIIRTLAGFNVIGERRAGRIGVWVRRPDKGAGCEDKIAAIGVRIKRWITLHGIALNIDCNLSHYAGIVPCGIRDPRWDVTSLADLGLRASMSDVDRVLRREFEQVFASKTAGGAPTVQTKVTGAEISGDPNRPWSDDLRLGSRERSGHLEGNQGLTQKSCE